MLSLPDLPGGAEEICRYRAVDAADYIRETDRSLMQLVTALWAVLALVYVSLALFTRKDSENSEKIYSCCNRR